MKTARYIIGITLLATVLISSCKNSTKSNTPDNSSNVLNIKHTENIQTRILPCNKEFIQITNISSANVIYSQGDYHIEATGDSAMIDLLKLTFDSGTLTIGNNGEIATGINTVSSNPITIRISSPELKLLSICANGGFSSIGRIETSDFIIGNLGYGNMQFDTIVCNTFKADNNYSGTVTINSVECDNAIVSTFGTSKTTASVIAKREVDILTGTESQTDININATGVSINANGKCKGKYNVDCNNLFALTADYAEISLTGTVKTKKTKSILGSNITDNLTKR